MKNLFKKILVSVLVFIFIFNVFGTSNAEAAVKYTNSSFYYNVEWNNTTVGTVKLWAKFSYTGSSCEVYSADESVTYVKSGYAISLDHSSNPDDDGYVFLIAVTCPDGSVIIFSSSYPFSDMSVSQLSNFIQSYDFKCSNLK